jgi:transposase-like protein
MTEQRKAVIKNADMSEQMQQDAVDCASQAMSKYNIEKVRNTDAQSIGRWLLEGPDEATRSSRNSLLTD